MQLFTNQVLFIANKNISVKNKVLRKFGFKKDQNGIINRYLREKDGWKSHLANTGNFVLHSAKEKEKESCVVLGSGWLLDIPIENLKEDFKKVYLVDIVHPEQITHKYRKFENIEFIKVDISGYIEPVYNFIKENKKKKAPLNKIVPHFPKDFENLLKNASFVVSVNILNQLDILICDYLKKQEIYSDEEIRNFRKIIQQKHIDLLPKNKSCIITDYEELNYDDHMNLIKSKLLVHIKLPDGKDIRKWKWNFDLRKTYHQNYKTVFKVMAWEK